ncbi:hypothetical protein SOV_23600 [Sporomusa ovata DSM 2662]|uniref:Uncharacterized protein n=1 Tax=Sporomusa ovata TaxID=2378 RepID=A0A0U1L3F9_9FIRM|nr:hypothetical protein [Sporomusa ovata]EQB25676.1 hypothetical protein SOV_4c03390 [Sporomusa ovata DSM 2662]CQR74232.1 hypothetical protein SpAn4DRAFT_0694 [Sporomusa ovata]
MRKEVYGYLAVVIAAATAYFFFDEVMGLLKNAGRAVCSAGCYCAANRQ